MPTFPKFTIKIPPMPIKVPSDPWWRFWRKIDYHHHAQPPPNNRERNGETMAQTRQGSEEQSGKSAGVELLPVKKERTSPPPSADVIVID